MSVINVGEAVVKKVKNDPRLGITPILILTAKGEEPDVVTGLELGADDTSLSPLVPGY